MKKIRLQSHEEEPPCNCKRLRCIENITEIERKEMLQYFNSLSSNDEQNVYLAGLMSLVPVQRRRNPQEEDLLPIPVAKYKKSNDVKEILQPGGPSLFHVAATSVGLIIIL
ncbi:unnamed protein product [Psylliodes chrysocephalus]|uniref:Uncharacterized protein n=1 Tax=Psylliodes chrysocephalus TaxID=3402493 RepID=A0A9P0G8H7_9CUCU|nr:unnamed protein product [Psylliodes chrysocephala]